MRVAVIGGGPAGCEAARRLAEGGVETVLFDPSFDREKPCGGGVPWAGYEEFLGPLTPESPACEIRDVLFESPSGRQVAIPLPRPLRIYSRRTLDRAWALRAEQAGAMLRVEKVVAVETSGMGEDSAPARAPAATGRRASPPVIVRTATTEHRFDALFGADGVRSLVRRSVAAPFAPEDLTQTLGVFVPGRTDSTARLAFVETLDGYLWSFPRIDHLAIGACAPLRPGGLAKLRRHLDTYLGRLLPEVRAENLPGYSALIPTLSPSSHARNRVSGPGWCLVGDAAGNVDPITREGIAWGLRASAIAAQAFLEGRPGDYAADWERLCAPELRWAAERRARFYAPDTTERLVRALDASRAIRAVMADLLLGRQPYRSLKRRLVRAAFPAAMRWTFRRLAG